MRALASRLRGRLSYATVVSAISLFLLLAGGAAFASGQLGKSSVGPKQLKKNAVTAAKIKKNAVTAAKLGKNAVTAAKIKAKAIGATSLDLGSTRYSRTLDIVKSAGPTKVAGKPTPVPLANPTYSQPPGEDDYYVGTFTGTFPPECTGAERDIFLGVYLDNSNATEPEDDTQILGASFHGNTPGQFTATVPLPLDVWSFQPGAATSHTLSAYGEVFDCGGTETGTIESVEIRVVGTK
jgi:hypothetical protein